MRLPESFLAELNARTPLASVIGRRVKLTRSGKDFKGCCPFHGEKTPSFHVYPDGFHCFGCGAHGDAISFVMQSQGSSFMEAVEQLAGEAGMDLPRPTPEAAEAERRRLDLAGVLEAASRSFARRLRSPEGRAALDYLRRRRLSDATIETFGLGWSGEGRGALAAELAAEGVAVPTLIEAGLMRDGEEGRPPYDLFFNRVMFPIRDRRGRVISFGGRTLGDAQPKYVNGPETALFSKRRNLYALDLAREGVRNGAELVVVEGYMDVIALHQAGFSGAVAPLGTALAIEQLEELWRLAPEPILCFDGDNAGARATWRIAETSLPLLTPEKTLRFVKLEAGEDPDSLLKRAGGISAMFGRLEGARGLSDTLFDMLREGVGPLAAASPEQRAAFFHRIELTTSKIADRRLSIEFRSALLGRFFELSRAVRKRDPFGKTSGRSIDVTRSSSALVESNPERARILTAVLIRHPELLGDLDHAYAELVLPEPYDKIRSALFRYAASASSLDSLSVMAHLHEGQMGREMEQVLSSTVMPLPDFAAENAMPADAEAGWWHFFGFVQGTERLRDEVAESQQFLLDEWTERAQSRHIALCTALNHLRRGEQGADD